jgi:PAS domain S-box-containing protein
VNEKPQNGAPDEGVRPQSYGGKKILAGLALAFAVLVFVSLILLDNASKQRKNTAWVVHTYEALSHLDLLLSSLVEAENGRRGYLLSGQERYLVQHDQATERSRNAFLAVRSLMKDNPRQLASLAQLEPLIYQRLNTSTNSIRSRQERGLDVPEQQAFMEEGHQAMVPILQLVAQMTEEENRLLQERAARQKKSADGANGLAVLATTLSLTLFVGLSVLLSRENRRRWKAEEVLRQTNRQLEQRVQQRTAELSQIIEKLEAADEFRSKIMESAVFGLGVLDVEGRFTLTNPRFSKMMGYAPTELLTRPFSVLLSKENTAALLPEFTRVLRDKQPLAHREVEVIRKDGSAAQVLFSWSPLLTQGQATGVVGTVLDITELKQMEHAVRDSEHRLQLIIDTALDGVVTIDSDGMIMNWNPQAEKMFGWSSQEVMGRRLSETIIPQAHREAHERGLKHFATSGTGPVLNRRIEISAVRRDGQEFPVELAITPIRSGSTVTFSAFIRDISERKQAENKVQAQLARLAQLHQITRAISERQDLASIFHVTVQSLEEQLSLDLGCICLYEPLSQMLTVSGVSTRSEALAKELDLKEQTQIKVDENGLSRCVHGRLVYEPDVSQVPFAFPQRLARGGLRSVVLAPLLVESKVFGVLLVARREADGFTSGDCEFLRQLSEHVALAAHQAEIHVALQQAYNDLRQSQQTVMQQERLSALGQMASGIAHDINNAISPVALYTESLLETEPGLSARTRDYLETIQRAIEDVAHTVSRMREFYRQRGPQLVHTPIQLNTMVNQVLELTRARWSDMSQQRGVVIDVRTELVPNLPVVLGVESEIREALINLVFNGVDAMPEGGVLTLRTRVAGSAAASGGSAAAQTVLVEVSDTGAGMDEETRRRCLEPFFTTKGERGTGLGLAMVYGVARRHKAEIEIASALGKGTTMGLSFPLADVTSPSEPGRTTTSSAVLARLRILLVDDDPLVIKSLRDTLEQDGHVISTADHGQAGVDAFSAAKANGEPFSLVITDLGMPYMDGRKVASAIKAMSPSTPVILLTGWGHRLIAEGDYPPHVDHVLSKPPRLRELREALASVIRGPGSEDESGNAG